MSTRLMLLAGCLLWIHCGGQGEPVSKTTGPVKQKRIKAKAGNYESASPPKGKNWSGWRYSGKRKDCFFRVDKQCFDSEVDACKAAKCGNKACVKSKSAPVKVTCGS